MGRALFNLCEDLSGMEECHNDKVDDFITQIKEGNVLLVCGKGFELNTEAQDEEGGKIYYAGERPVKDFYDYLLQVFNYQLKTSAADFTELVYDRAFQEKKISIYSLIRKTIQSCELDVNDVNPKLRQLLATGYFKTVFTTTFDPLLEIAMKEQWGEKVRVLNIRHADVMKRDIRDKDDLYIPTIYYLFGSADESGQKFVVTDNDALEILRVWQKDMQGSNLMEFTKSKYLFAVGCGYEDWLFRFFWYTLRDKEMGIHKGCVTDLMIDPSLERYLTRNNVITDKDTDSLLDRIIAGLTQKKDGNLPSENMDVFISYSRKDRDFADRLYRILAAKGVSVWYDKQNLMGEGKRFMAEIERAISRCRIFVPVLSEAISQEYGNAHVYRTEWDMAESIQGQKGWNFTYCLPVLAQGYDLERAYSDGVIDKWLKERDISSCTSDADLEAFADKIIQNLKSIHEKGR